MSFIDALHPLYVNVLLPNLNPYCLRTQGQKDYIIFALNIYIYVHTGLAVRGPQVPFSGAHTNH